MQLLEDVSRARAELQQPRLKLMALTAVQLRAAVKAVLLAPFTLPAALAARWQALFAGSSYENFLMSEGEQVWAWRNRTENERWFWEVLAVDRWAGQWVRSTAAAQGSRLLLASLVLQLSCLWCCIMQPHSQLTFWCSIAVMVTGLLPTRSRHFMRQLNIFQPGSVWVRPQASIIRKSRTGIRCLELSSPDVFCAPLPRQRCLNCRARYLHSLS